METVFSEHEVLSQSKTSNMFFCMYHRSMCHFKFQCMNKIFMLVMTFLIKWPTQLSSVKKENHPYPPHLRFLEPLQFVIYDSMILKNFWYAAGSSTFLLYKSCRARNRFSIFDENLSMSCDKSPLYSTLCKLIPYLRASAPFLRTPSILSLANLSWAPMNLNPSWELSVTQIASEYQYLTFPMLRRFGGPQNFLC